MKKVYFVFFAIVFLSFSCMPSLSKLVNDMCVSEPGKVKVLIAMQGGQFKDSVITVVKSALENESYCVKVITLGTLNDEVMENYSACIIVNTCHIGGISGKATKFLKKLTLPEKKRIVLFTTTGSDKGWHPKDVGVDCVSSASKLNKALFIADSITIKTRSILKGR
jgi:hypothetical protein